MHLQTVTDPTDHSTCVLTYEEAAQCLVLTWKGFVGPSMAQRGGETYLEHALAWPSPFLLNDNTQLHGPWFDGLDWLAAVWAPQAARLGLRYVAHVVQADARFDTITQQMPAPAPFELQIFQDVAEARRWLRDCRATVHAA